MSVINKVVSTLPIYTFRLRYLQILILRYIYLISPDLLITKLLSKSKIAVSEIIYRHKTSPTPEKSLINTINLIQGKITKIISDVTSRRVDAAHRNSLLHMRQTNVVRNVRWIKRTGPQQYFIRRSERC